MSNKERGATFFIAAISDQSNFAELSHLIDLAADEGWSKGDAYSRGGQRKIYKFTRWALAERAFGSANDWEEAIDNLFARLEPFKENIAKLPTEVVVKFQVNLTEDNDVFGFGLSARQVNFLSEICASVDMSIVVSIPAADKSSVES